LDEIDGVLESEAELAGDDELDDPSDEDAPGDAVLLTEE
jgi:hypothetical protein